MNTAGVHKVPTPTYGWTGTRHYDRMAQLLRHLRKTDGCWLWTGQALRNGYGTLIVEGRRVLAHRQSYTLHVGPIPTGLTLDHLCRTPLCVKPSHLEPVTHSENVRRAAAARRRNTCLYGHSLADAYIVRRRGIVTGRTCRPCKIAAARTYYAANLESVRAAERARYGRKRDAA